MELEECSGAVERITYHNPENGFCVLKIKVKKRKDLVVLTGHLPSIYIGEQITAHGTWFNDKQHGMQFQATKIEATTPNSLEGIEKYLSSGLIRGVGPYYARKLMNCFKEDVFTVIENQPELLTTVAGIGKVRVESIKQSWVEQKVIRDIMIFLQSHNISTNKATRIYRTYGDKAIQIVTENPYRLAKDVMGIGFVNADIIARKLGIGVGSMIRAEAGIVYALFLASKEGSTCMYETHLVSEAMKLLDVPKELIEEGVSKLIGLNEIIRDSLNGEQALFLADFHKCEQDIALNINELLEAPNKLPHIDKEKSLRYISEELKVNLADLQKEALKLALSSKILVITGGPGTGKTTLVKSIITILKKEGVNIKLAAPTGKAAKRLSEVSGIEAKTIHRLLEFNPRIRSGFAFNEDRKLEVDLIIVDEASMIDVLLMNNLLKAIPLDASLLIVGDIDQLPSVGAGNFLHDLIDSQVVEVVKLTEIFRQAAESLIVTNAHLINKGIMPELEAKAQSDFYFVNLNQNEDLYKKSLTLMCERIPKSFGFKPSDIQILCPMQQSASGARAFNLEIQKVLNPPSVNSIEKWGVKFSVNDKVMQVENNYDKEVYNGDVGFISAINKEEDQVDIMFDDRLITYDSKELEQIILAYAITIHKSQGSEYPVVIIPLLMQNFVMLKRNLLYTAVTRGKKLVIILGEKQALKVALGNSNTNRRYSKLREFLKK